MATAYVLAGATRGAIVGVLIAFVGAAFTSVGVTRPLYLVGFGVVITVLFAGIGVIGGLWADDWDDLTMMNQFILRPLVFFGGVFYSIAELPPLLETLSYLNPMVYMVNGVRYGFLGASEVDPNVSLAVLAGLATAVVALDIALFRRGYGLTE